MRVFLTGASGFIGYHVMEMLISKGYEVAALVRPGNPMTRLKHSVNNFEIFSTSLEDTYHLKKSIRTFKPEACIHLAWYSEPGKYLNSDKNIQLLVSSLSLFQILIEAGCKQIIAAGTCFEYDTSFGYLHENTITRPESLYAASKLSCYLSGSQLATNSNVTFAWGRIFYPYGQFENPNRLVPAAISALKNNQPFSASPGEQIRDYIHVSDVASAFCALLDKQANGVYNISSGYPVSIRQLLETIGELMNQKDLIRIGELPYRAWEPSFICGANNRLKSLGWNPIFSLKNGLWEVIKGNALDTVR